MAGVVMTSCGQGVTRPDRPPNVPLSATWAGGLDGGAWVNCKPTSIEGRLTCDVWSDDGASWGHGDYVADGKGCQRTPSGVPTGAWHEFVYADAEEIDLGSECRFVPDGMNSSDNGDGHGIKQQYDHGREVGPKIEY